VHPQGKGRYSDQATALYEAESDSNGMRHVGSNTTEKMQYLDLGYDAAAPHCKRSRLLHPGVEHWTRNGYWNPQEVFYEPLSLAHASTK